MYNVGYRAWIAWMRDVIWSIVAYIYMRRRRIKRRGEPGREGREKAQVR